MNHVLTIIKYWHSKDLQPFTTILTNSDVIKNLNAAENNNSTTLCLKNVMKNTFHCVYGSVYSVSPGKKKLFLIFYIIRFYKEWVLSISVAVQAKSVTIQEKTSRLKIHCAFVLTFFNCFAIIRHIYKLQLCTYLN